MYCKDEKEIWKELGKNSIFGNEKKIYFENGCCGSSPMNFCLQ